MTQPHWTRHAHMWPNRTVPYMKCRISKYRDHPHTPHSRSTAFCGVVRSLNSKSVAPQPRRWLRHRPKTAQCIPVREDSKTQAQWDHETLSESAGGANVYAGLCCWSFLATVTTVTIPRILSYWVRPTYWPVAYIASLNVRRVNKSHNRHNNDLINGESQLSASDAKVALFLGEFIFTSENNANKAPMDFQKSCF